MYDVTFQSNLAAGEKLARLDRGGHFRWTPGCPSFQRKLNGFSLIKSSRMGRKICKRRTSLVAWGLRICLPVQETWVWYWSGGRSPRVTEQLSLRARTTQPALEPMHHYNRARTLQLRKPMHQPVLCNKRSLHTATRERPGTATKTQCSQKSINKVFCFAF